MIQKHIPNAITCGNLFAGCIGIVYACNGHLEIAAYLAVIAAIFDFFDGTAARLLHVKSNIGKELDSLADVVSFGVLPSIVMFSLMKEAEPLFTSVWIYSAFLIAVFSAIRLAKFNVDTRQSDDFIGLNVPTNALFILSLVFIKPSFPFLIKNNLFLLTVTLLSCYLLLSNIRFFSLKLNNKGLQGNLYKLIFVFISLVFVAMFNFASVPLVLILYFILSQLHFKFNK